MARYQPPGGRGAQPRGLLPAQQLPPPDPALRPLWLLVLAVFWPQLSAYYNCMGSANTVAAQHVCHTQLSNSVGGEISVLQNGR